MNVKRKLNDNTRRLTVKKPVRNLGKLSIGAAIVIGGFAVGSAPAIAAAPLPAATSHAPAATAVAPPRDVSFLNGTLISGPLVSAPLVNGPLLSIPFGPLQLGQFQ